MCNIYCECDRCAFSRLYYMNRMDYDNIEQSYHHGIFDVIMMIYAMYLGFSFEPLIYVKSTRSSQIFQQRFFFSSWKKNFMCVPFCSDCCLMQHTIFHLKMHNVCFHCDHRLLQWHKNSMKITTIIIKGRTRK